VLVELLAAFGFADSASLGFDTDLEYAKRIGDTTSHDAHGK